MIRVLISLDNGMSRADVCLPDGISYADHVQALVDTWLAGKAPCLVLPERTRAVIFDDEKCVVIASL